MKSKILTALIFAATLSGCATSQKIQVVQPGDSRLTCEEIAAELAELDAVKNENDENKGMTGTNIAAALFFWPALAYTYLDAGEAEELIRERKNHLAILADENSCS